MYPSLWTSLLVAMHDDIENRSINIYSINCDMSDSVKYNNIREGVKRIVIARCG